MELLSLDKHCAKFSSKFGTTYLLMYKHIMDGSVDFAELKNALGLDPDTTQEAITKILDLAITDDIKEFMDSP